jgi:N-acetyl-gamma-glutamyl-phosphate reductase
LHLSALGRAMDLRGLHNALSDYYSGEPFVRVVPMTDDGVLDSGYFDVQACNESNRCELFVFAGADQAILMARLDNLGKGASGAAVQTMNVHLGLDEGLGLVAA